MEASENTFVFADADPTETRTTWANLHASQTVPRRKFGWWRKNRPGFRGPARNLHAPNEDILDLQLRNLREILLQQYQAAATFCRCGSRACVSGHMASGFGV